MRFQIAIAGLLAGVVAAHAAPPPPAIPPAEPLPADERGQIAAEFEAGLSQIFHGQVTLLSDRQYKERNGSTTGCAIGRIGGHQFRLADSTKRAPIINPTETQWVDAGCTRPGYQLVR